MFQKTLQIYDIAGYFYYPKDYPRANLLLAVPLTKRPPAQDRDQARVWDLAIKKALLDLQKGGDYKTVFDSPGLSQVIPLDSDEESYTKPFKWNGWQHLVLPNSYTFGFKEECHIPMGPTRNIDEWPHDFCWRLRDILAALDNGGSVLQFHPNGLASAGYLEGFLSAMSDPQVSPGKIVYHLLHAGLGLNSFHYGIMLGMDNSAWERYL